MKKVTAIVAVVLAACVLSACGGVFVKPTTDANGFQSAAFKKH